MAKYKDPNHPSDSDWIIYYGITSGYALGPFCSNPGSPFPYSLGQLTDHPQQAIGWRTREAAEAVLSQMGHSGAKVVSRGEAIASWGGKRGLGPTMGTVDWGALR